MIANVRNAPKHTNSVARSLLKVTLPSAYEDRQPILVERLLGRDPAFIQSWASAVDEEEIDA